ncbi:MAG: serine/threonine protein kinase [Actinobacteria bacterium HGW-Actinobacteria-4]|nr:MAG: serine/threonine protein kinase [Actinobacteria bacterium HGW-Actinobacteria-4]
MLGRLIDGRYEVRERVAAGGMATVYLAFDKRLERDVALKVMHNRLANEPDGREFVHRFRREAKAAARLTHPGMVRVYDQGVDGDISYLTMEYVRGQNLRHRISREATIPVGEALAITEAVLDALAAAHRQGLVHRDIKPENVLLDDDGRPRVADFGLARAVTEVTSTATGTIMGTVAYLGPELVSRGQADARTDVYSVGILLYEMVTGRQPFTGNSAIEVASRHVHEDVPPPSSHVPWLPPELDHLIEAFTARDPAARPRDAVAALSMLRQTRTMMDDPTMARRADSPSGTIPVVNNSDDTTVLNAVPAGSTVALPIGLGEPIADLGTIEAEIIDDDPEAQEPVPIQHRALWWAGAIAAAILFLGALGLWWYNSSGPGAYTTVPPVAGNTQAEALSILASAGLEGVVDHVYHDDVIEGRVIGTDPPEQSQVLNSSEVTVLVSLGPLMAEVPEVVGTSEAEARATLEEAGFTVGDVTYVFSDTVPESEVTATTPSAGETVRHDASIVLVVSGGPEPIKIPNVVGNSEETAVGILGVYALEITVVHERTNEDVAKGRVFRQDPAGNADGFRTQAVTIYVSAGSPLITIPDYTGVPGDEATERAEELGLKVERAKIPGRPKDAEVVGQQPSPGTEVERGSTLILYY